MARGNDFYEPDEPVQDVEAAFERGRKDVTRRPVDHGQTVEPRPDVGGDSGAEPDRPPDEAKPSPSLPSGHSNDDSARSDPS